MLTRSFASITVFAIGAGAAARAQQIAYNDFGPGDTYGSTGYLLYGPQASAGYRTQAFQFVSLAAGNITNLVIPTQHSAAGNTFVYELYTDAGGMPGSSLGVIGQTSGFLTTQPPDPAPNQIPADGSIAITTGTTYWLVGRGSGSTQGNVRANSQGVNGLRAYIAPFATTWQIDTQPVPAFRLEVNGPITRPCYANCDGSSVSPVLTANDFQCFLNTFAAGCS